MKEENDKRIEGGKAIVVLNGEYFVGEDGCEGD